MSTRLSLQEQFSLMRKNMQSPVPTWNKFTKWCDPIETTEPWTGELENSHPSSIQALLSQSQHANGVQCDKDGNSLLMLMIYSKPNNVDLHSFSANDFSYQNKRKANVLHYAASTNSNQIRWLRSNGADVNQGDKTGITPLMIASWHGHLEAVTALVDEGAFINETNDAGMTALMFAAWRGHDVIADKLMDSSANIMQTTKFGRTALHYACLSKSETIAKSLCSKDGNILKQRDQSGHTVFQSFAARGDAKMLQLLQQLGAPVNDEDDIERSGHSALTLAVKSRSEECVQFVLKHKLSSIDSETKWGTTALIEAVLMEKRNLVKLLLNEGASKFLITKQDISAVSVASVSQKEAIRILFRHDVTKCQAKRIYAAVVAGSYSHVRELSDELHAENSAGFSPLMLATVIGNIDMALTILINKFSVLNQVASNGLTALFCALLNGHRELADILLAFGADINIKDQNGDTILHKCVKEMDIGAVKLVLQFGADADLKDGTNRTALLIAQELKWGEGISYFGQLAEVENTTAEGVDTLFSSCKNGNLAKVQNMCVSVHIRNAKGSTLLHIAVAKGHYNIVKYLVVEKSAPINVLDANGRSPLVIAARRDRPEILKLLLNHNPVLNLMNKKGETALSYAISNNFVECTRLLLDRGALLNLKNVKNPGEITFDKSNMIKVNINKGLKTASKDNCSEVQQLLQERLSAQVTTCLTDVILDSACHPRSTEHQQLIKKRSDRQFSGREERLLAESALKTKLEKGCTKDKIRRTLGFCQQRQKNLVQCVLSDNGCSFHQTCMMEKCVVEEAIPTQGEEESDQRILVYGESFHPQEPDFFEVNPVESEIVYT